MTYGFFSAPHRNILEINGMTYELEDIHPSSRDYGDDGDGYGTVSTLGNPVYATADGLYAITVSSVSSDMESNEDCFLGEVGAYLGNVSNPRPYVFPVAVPIGRAADLVNDRLSPSEILDGADLARRIVADAKSMLNPPANGDGAPAP